MGSPINYTSWELTGRHRFVRGWFGRPSLWVEERRMVYAPTTLERDPAAWQPETRWRRGQMADLGNVYTTGVA